MKANFKSQTLVKLEPTHQHLTSQNEQSFIQDWRQFHQHGLLAIKEDFYQHADTQRLFKQHVALIDQLLTRIWQHAKLRGQSCLIAVGGYGRGELYPYSDLDLLILISNDSTQYANENSQIEVFIGLLWDIGLNVGHSVRTLQDCLAEAEKDITTQTNLIECRLLIGNQPLFEKYQTAIIEKMEPLRFFNAKLQEQDNRYAKFNDTAYNLEPNIKESPGGLRDIHIILWLTRSLLMSEYAHGHASCKLIFKAGNTHIWTWLLQQQIVSPLELRKIYHHTKNLQQLRIRLHFLSNRREDRLLFDFQNEVAASLGYQNKPRKRASEQLMQSYYRSVKFIQVMNEILLKSLHQLFMTTPPRIKEINTFFESRNQLLEAKTANLLQLRPSAIFEAFLAMQQHDEILGLGASYLRNLQRVKHLVNQDFRQDPRNKALFIEILSQPNGVNHMLRAMNRYGILGAYLPPFGKIVGQMQHDLFHVYTVDEHILNVLANLRRFAKPELKHEFPLCSQLFAKFDKPYLLYLGALFHDIAKGRNGDHSTLGMKDAAKFCRQHGLAKEDCELVAWLVDAHLKMSATAQKADLSDPKVIETFAHFVKNQRRLIALYLLTVADIRGTSPIVWNAWKARLLESLFQLTSHALTNQLLYTELAITTRKTEAYEKLNRFGLSPSSYEPLWEKFGKHYFVRFETDEIIWQSRLLTPHLHSNKPIVRARLSPKGDGIQVMIYQLTQNDLFARICNFFDRMGYSIAEAKIFTSEHHYALDSFIILDDSGKSVSYTGLLKFIETELTRKIEQNGALENPLEGRVSRIVKHTAFESKITITEVADNQHNLEITTSDKPGFLAKIAAIFLKYEVDLHNAKINTMGNRAEDSFLISAYKNQKLTPENIKAIQIAISSTLI